MEFGDGTTKAQERTCTSAQVLQVQAVEINVQRSMIAKVTTSYFCIQYLKFGL